MLHADWMSHDERRSPPPSQQELLANKLSELPVYKAGTRPEIVYMQQPLTPGERDLIVAALRAHKPHN